MTKNVGVTARFVKLLIFFFENFYGASYIFSCRIPSETFSYLALVLRAYYAICRYMFAAGFQFNSRQITGKSLKQSVVSDMLLFCRSWFKYITGTLNLIWSKYRHVPKRLEG